MQMSHSVLWDRLLSQPSLWDRLHMVRQLKEDRYKTEIHLQILVLFPSFVRCRLKVTKTKEQKPTVLKTQMFFQTLLHPSTTYETRLEISPQVGPAGKLKTKPVRNKFSSPVIPLPSARGHTGSALHPLWIRLTSIMCSSPCDWPVWGFILSPCDWPSVRVHPHTV